MKQKTAFILFSAALLALPAAASSQTETDVYKCGNASYSHIPSNLRKQGCELVNLRTQTSRPAVATGQQNQLPQIQGNQGEVSAADLQAMANQKAQEEIRAQEEENRKLREQNEATKASNCNVAKMNLQHAQNARVANRDQLIQQYQNNVNLYCN